MVKRLKKKPSARRAAKRKPRPQHKRVTKADQLRKLFNQLSPEELADKKLIDVRLRAAGIKAVGADIYRIRREIAGVRAATTATGTENSGDSLRAILLVKKTAEQVGGVARLKEIVILIERILQ